MVHSELRRQVIARVLLKAVETEFPGAPVYAKALGVAKPFFEACGYRPMSAEVRVLFNRNGMAG
jgi:hypothetical protein